MPEEPRDVALALLARDAADPVRESPNDRSARDRVLTQFALVAGLRRLVSDRCRAGRRKDWAGYARSARRLGGSAGHGVIA